MSKDDNNTFEISRRKTLAALGTIGAASAGAGLGTSAWFSDTESFENNIVTAGTMDLIVEYYSWWDQGMAGSGSVSGAADGKAVSAELSDVKPGDNGLIALSPRIETNPAYLWLCGELTANDENGLTEPEALVDDTEGQGELAQNVEVTVKYCDIGDVSNNDEFTPATVSTEQEIWSGSLADFLMAIQAGVPLDGGSKVPKEGIFFEPGDQSCFAGTDDGGDTPSLCLDWEVPTEVGNEIQSDSLSFDLQMYAEQCRHNDGTQNPCSKCGEPASDPVTLTTSDSPSWITATVDPGATTTITVELDDNVYADWPDNQTSYVMEANVDISTDGLGDDDGDETDDFRIGWGGEDAAPRDGTAGGYIKRNEPGDGGRFTTPAEDISGFSATESSDKMTYTFEIDWTSDDLPETPDTRSAPEPCSIQVNEVFGSDGGEGIQKTDVDPITEPSGELYTGI